MSRIDDGVDAVSWCVLARHQTGPSRCAVRSTRVGLSKNESGPGQAIDVRRLDERVVHEADVSPAKVIHQDDDNARRWGMIRSTRHRYTKCHRPARDRVLWKLVHGLSLQRKRDRETMRSNYRTQKSASRFALSRVVFAIMEKNWKSVALNPTESRPLFHAARGPKENSPRVVTRGLFSCICRSASQ